MVKDEVVARIHGGPIRVVRSTLICSSVSELRAHGLFDDYVRHLAPEAAEVILSAVAASWMPIEAGIAHYAACDRLELGRDKAFQIGLASGRRLQQSVFNTFALLAQKVGIDPWNVFPTYPRVWARHFDGGGLLVTRCGPKDALVVLDLPFARFAYFRYGLLGLTQSVLGMFAKTVYAREVASSASSVSVKVSWV